MSNEIELKFEINDTDIADLSTFLNQWANSDAAELADPSRIKQAIVQLTLSNTYYDTKDYYLRNHGCGLRVRGSESVAGQHYEITLKRDGKAIAGLHERAEFNVELPNNQLDLSVLPSSALPDNCDIKQLQKNLIPLFSTDFKRQAWLISFADSEIEVALDQGQIISNGKTKTIQEVELEIKQGLSLKESKKDLLNFAIELSRFHLHLFSQSKAARGYRLLQNAPLKIAQFDQQTEQYLSKLLKFWQQNEEYALEADDLSFYQQTLNQVAKVLAAQNLPVDTELAQWQATLSSIDSVKNFAYSEVNTQLKLSLIALINN